MTSRTTGPVDSLLTQAAARVTLSAASRIRVGNLTVKLPDGTTRVFGDRASTLRGKIHIHDLEALRRLLIGGEVGGGEAYMDGLWSSPDLVGLISMAVANREGLALSKGWWRAPAKVARTVAHRRNRNTRTGSRRNITAHYDLGNEFYRLWLDETMTYSSAVFESPQQSLADAQRNKYRAMAERAGVKAGDHVLEIGTGWGGMALYLAGEIGARVTTATISQAQHDLARERIHEAGLDDIVEVQLRDYRELSGQYDAVVSIEMLEAVGHRFLDGFFATVDRVLRPGGGVALQTITIPDQVYDRYRRGTDWIRDYIFPGGHLPSLGAIQDSLAKRTGLVVERLDDMSLDYAETLHLWRTRFHSAESRVRELGFDDRFIRIWDFYLATCEAAFRDRQIGVLQLGLLRSGRGG